MTKVNRTFTSAHFQDVVKRLSPDDFIKLPTSQPFKFKLTTRLPKLSFIFFKQDKCIHSQEAQQHFNQLPLKFKDITFGSLNLTTHNTFANTTEDTNTHITYTPFFLFYIDGIPFYRFDSTIRTVDSFSRHLEMLTTNYYLELAKRAEAQASPKIPPNATKT